MAEREFDISNLPSNTLLSKAPVKAEQKNDISKPRVNRVATGKLNKSIGKKLVDTFIEEDMDSVKSYVRDDILIPRIKEAFVDIIEGAVELLFGTGSSGRRRKSGSVQTTDKVSYYSYHKSDADRRNNQRYEPKKKDSGVKDYDSIILETRADAESVLDAMRSAISEYGSATVGDLYDTVGITNTEFTTQEWGWKNLDNCRVRPVHGGWIIDLPEPESLD